jgi:trigger factor
VKVSSKEQPHREAVLTIELDPEEVEPYLERAYRKLVQQTNIHGFRKGKAPRRVVEQIYGREYLLNEAMDFLLPEVTTKAMEDASLDVGGVPSVNLDQLDPPSITATVPLTPTVDLGDYLDVRVPKEAVNVTPEQVNEILEQLRMDTAPWEPVEEPTVMDDLLNVTVRGWTDEKEFLNQERSDFVPREGTRIPVPGFAEALVDMKAYETKQFTIAVPEDFEHAEVAGKSCTFEVTVHIVKRKKPGPLDDEFAKSVGEDYESLADMRKKIEDNLAKNQEHAINVQHQRETLQKVMESATIELSPLIVEHELEHMLHSHEDAVRSGRMTPEQYQQYLSWVGKSAEEIREASWPEAEERIKRTLVLREVAEQHNLDASDEEMRAEIETLAAGAGPDADAIRKSFEDDDDRMDALRRFVVNQKTVEFLSERAADNQASEPKASAASDTPGEGPTASDGAGPAQPEAKKQDENGGK